MSKERIASQSPLPQEFYWISGGIERGPVLARERVALNRKVSVSASSNHSNFSRSVLRRPCSRTCFRAPAAVHHSHPGCAYNWAVARQPFEPMGVNNGKPADKVLNIPVI